MPPRILVVDSHGDVRTLIRALLDTDHLHIDEAEDREHAASLVRSRPYAALVVDSAGMSDDTGILLMIRREQPEMLSRTIVLASRGPSSLSDDLNLGGVALVLDKPVDAAELRGAIRTLTASEMERRATTPGTDSEPTVH